MSTGETAIEWMSFDAVSDDGEELVSVRFFNRYIFSRRSNDLLPAVTFVHSVGGRHIASAVTTFGTEDIKHSSNGLSIGERNHFSREKAGYGDGYVVSVSLPLNSGKRLEAEFEWLALEGNTAIKPVLRKAGCGDWNIQTARADVSGRVTTVDGVRHFRGTGSHSLYKCASEGDLRFGVRLSGSAHFVDSTVFFCREGEQLSDDCHASVALIEQESVHECVASSAEHYWTRTRYGIKYPRRFLLTSKDLKLRIKLMVPYQSELCLARFPAEITLTRSDETPRRAIGWVELLEPRRLRSGLVKMFAGLGVGRES